MQKSELNSYLENRGIYVLNSKISKDKNDNDKSVYKQIDNIVFFHDTDPPMSNRDWQSGNRRFLFPAAFPLAVP